ncbi:hypothetical protein CIT25_35065 [Mesorhizobium mediterraneum]|uniref:Uncharacterized protein n=2 Tax=Mesorhizobium mediterraneum TaxID=43617 RepID=A0AB36QZE3_9HYPH|nr:hypothetical protein CIT25_35065 [Mesorhizobium mediterraneum]
MVSQAAYLTNLKSYAKLRFRGDDDEDARRAVRDLDNESDRGAIILAATNVEDMLELRILEKLPTLQVDEVNAQIGVRTGRPNINILTQNTDGICNGHC